MTAFVYSMLEGFNRTKVTYIVELSPGGWFWMWPELAATIAGDNVMGSLTALKNTLERNEDAELEGLSVEDAARKKFAKDQAKKQAKESVTLVDDARSSREDLAAVVSYLERKLVDINAMENQGDNVTDLKNKVVSDLKKGKARVAAMGK
jgi:hypothetical protein